MSKRIDRRQFIVAGSAAVAGLAATRVQGQVVVVTQRQLFVGFAPRMTRGRAVGRSGAAVFPADTFGRTEASLLRTGARFSIRGMTRRDETPLWVRLTVMHPAEGLEQKLPFYAWSYEGSDRRASSPIAFNVPIDPALPLDVVVRVGEAENIVSFTVAPAEGAIALNHGSYIFAFADRAPDWSSLAISGESLLLDGGLAPFDYLILSVSSPSS